MNQLPNKAYGPPATLVYATPEADIRASWGPTTWQQFHTCTVRGVPVVKLSRGEADSRNIVYSKCVFPDGSVRVVNEGNIRVHKVKSNGHAIK